MKIIDKIEIKYFRSFDKFKVEIIDLKDINIFSGKNDSGKSNVLRALNLFFNYETDIGKPINFELDFSRYRYAEIKEDKKRRKSQSGKDVREQRSFISVKIHFDITKIKSSSSILPKKFWISRTWKPDSRFNTPIEENNIETEYLSKIKDRRTLKKGYQGLLSQSTTKLLKRIRFEYIPAIKDKNFHSYLFSKLQETILSSRSSTISKQSKELEAVILNSTNKLYDKFKKKLE